MFKLRAIDRSTYLDIHISDRLGKGPLQIRLEGSERTRTDAFRVEADGDLWGQVARLRQAEEKED